MRRRSFTLVETVLVVVILALTAATVGYQYYRSMDRTVLRSGAYRLMNMAQYARLLAGEQHRPCKLHVDLTEGTYWLTEQQTGIAVEAGEAEEAGEEETIRDLYARPIRLPEELHFKLVRVEGAEAAGEGEISLTFNTDGTAQAGLIQISSKKRTYTLVIYPWTGRAELVGKEVNELPVEVTDLDAIIKR